MSKLYKESLSDSQKKLYKSIIADGKEETLNKDLIDIFSIVTDSNSESLSDFSLLTWYHHMPISVELSRQIVDKSKYMDKKNVRNMFFIEKTLHIKVEEFLNILVNIGNSLGVDKVAHTIYSNALEGDEKYCRMYLDMFKGKILDDNSVNDNLMRISVEFDKEFNDDPQIP